MTQISIIVRKVTWDQFYKWTQHHVRLLEAFKLLINGNLFNFKKHEACALMILEKLEDVSIINMANSDNQTWVFKFYIFCFP